MLTQFILHKIKTRDVVLYTAVILQFASSQVDSRFDPMDWVLFRQSGSITSISQGYSYIYVGSSHGGVYRYNIYSQDWEDPLTLAQGLPHNTIESVYFDKNTGTLWVATPNHISYSYDREGEWYNIEKGDIGMSDNPRIKNLGSTIDFLWINAGAMFYKLDRSTGILLNVMPNPDNPLITWSSGQLEYFMEFPQYLQDYIMSDGWIMLPDKFLDYYGREVMATTIFKQENGNIWIGTDNGYILIADPQMEVFRPDKLGLANSHITSLIGTSTFYLAGRSHDFSKGITYFDPNRNIIDWVEPDVTINLPDVSYLAGLETPKHLWFGGDGNISIYNKKRDYWKNIITYTTTKIYAIELDSNAVWIGGIDGVERFDDAKTKHYPFALESAFHSAIVYDIDAMGNEVWFATNSGMFIYDKKRERLIPGNQWTNGDDDIMFLCWQTEVQDSLIYTATSSGVFQWNRHDRSKILVMNPTQFNNRPVKSLKVIDDIIFIGTDNGLYRMHKNGSGYYHYNYSFIRHINDMYINDEECWLGTDQGLVWFNWRRDI